MRKEKGNDWGYDCIDVAYFRKDEFKVGGKVDAFEAGFPSSITFRQQQEGQKNQNMYREQNIRRIIQNQMEWHPQLIGLREKLQENPIFHGNIYGFL